MFGETQDNFAIVPITTYQTFYGKRSRSINITVSSFESESYDDLIEKAIGEMRIIRKVPVGEEDDFGIFSNQSLLTTMDGVTSNVRIGAFIIAGIALLAAGVGIMNIMLVSVTERTKEIGIRKAIGARKSSILIQFLSEAIILCQIGGVVGIVLGVAVGNMAGSMIDAAATIPIDWVVIGVFMCVLIGVTFGTYPAAKAASLDPIEALRYE
jgi:putative ABC transport system permease protein